MKTLTTNNYLFLFLIQLSLSAANSALLKHAKCSVDDSACIRAQATAILPAFTQGIPEIGIEKLDKMYIDFIDSSAGNLNYSVSNTEVEGLKDATIEDISINMRLKYIVVLFHTTLKITSDYNANGTVYGVPVFGSGKVNIVRKHLRINMVLFFNIEQDKNDKSIMNIYAYHYGFDVMDGVQYDYQNLYNGDKERGERLNTFLNKNWLLISNYGRELVVKIIDNIYNSIKIYMRQVPLEDLVITSKA